MRPLRISNATRILAETQDEYYALAIRDVLIEEQPAMVSVWEPTPKETELLQTGGLVQMIVSGTLHPPVSLSVQEHDDPVVTVSDAQRAIVKCEILEEMDELQKEYIRRFEKHIDTTHDMACLQIANALVKVGSILRGKWKA